MAIEHVTEYFSNLGLSSRIKEFGGSCATVEEAAQTIGVAPSRIAKTITLRKEDGCMMLVMAGTASIDNKKFRHHFGMKARMLSFDEVTEMTGQTVGGVSPFAIPGTVSVYIDVSIKQYDTLFPACGAPNRVVELAPDEIYTLSKAAAWVDVCK